MLKNAFIHTFQGTETAVQRLCGATAMTADEKSILLVSHINKNIPHKVITLCINMYKY